jgi:hypothetical protein
MKRDRIHQALDGDLPVEQLTAPEAEAYRQYLQALGQAINAPPQLPPIDVTAGVMRRISATHARQSLGARLNRLLGWLWAPQSVTVRPAFAGAFVIALAALATMRALQPTSAPVLQVATDTTSAVRILVQFRLGAADASEVALVGDFTSWKPDHQLRQIAPGVWAVDVALEPGVYNYGFLVNGEQWTLDPLAPRITDGFGGANSRLAVLGPLRRS